MLEAAAQALDIMLADPAVDGVGSSVGASGCTASVNQGRMFISLKPLSSAAGSATAARHRPHARPARAASPGISVFMFAAAGHPRRRRGRPTSQYQFTLWSPDIDELNDWAPKRGGRA